MLPAPRVVARPYDPDLYAVLVRQGYDPYQARVAAGRMSGGASAARSLTPGLCDLTPPWGLCDLDAAAALVCSVMEAGGVIGLETDHDCDGQSAHAVLLEAFVGYLGYPRDRIRSYIGHRLEEGYGLSDKLLARILADPIRPALIITADNGSSNAEQITTLVGSGIQVIVTDHHAIPREGVPRDASAVLNPTRTDCHYGDPAIAGCMVAWLLMVAVRARRIAGGFLPADAPHLEGLLDFVAVGTVADCVSLAASSNNRAVIRYGLRRMARQARPCWRVLAREFPDVFDCQGIAFTVAPLLNSDGRLGTALQSVSFLGSETDAEAAAWLAVLIASNQERKAIQKGLLIKALAAAHLQYADQHAALSIFDPDGHAGVHGIVAARIKEAFGRPCGMFAPKTEDLWVGSVRGVPGLDTRAALETVDQALPGVIVAFGGHTGAAGLSLRPQGFTAFQAAFSDAIRAQAAKHAVVLGPVHYTDGAVDPSVLDPAWVAQLYERLHPFGRGFELPIFTLEAVLGARRPLGQGGLHWRVDLQVGRYRFAGTCFDRPDLPDAGSAVHVLCTPSISRFQRVARMDIRVVHMVS